MIEIIISNYMTISFFCLFACIAIFHGYLSSEKAANYKASMHSCFWPELIFRYRDYTRQKSTKLHYLYYLAVFSVIILFGSGILFGVTEILLLEKPLNYIGLFLATIPIGLVLTLWVCLAKVKYY